MANLFSNSATLLKPGTSVAVHKFGGSSLASRERLFNVVGILTGFTSVNDMIVVSANGNVTDWLQAFVTGQLDALGKIHSFYHQLASQTLIDSESWLKEFNEDIERLKSQSYSSEEILSKGEHWSAKLLVALLSEQKISSRYVDAREILKTDSIDDYRQFDAAYFEQGLKKLTIADRPQRLIITGYIAKNSNHQTITLGRNGSDYTASLIAYFCQAKSITLWTDVDGIYSADPRLVEGAFSNTSLTFQQAKALASMGTNVLHKKTISPIENSQIALYVRSSLKPDSLGTCVSSQADKVLVDGINKPGVKSIALKQELNLINIQLNESWNKERLLLKFFEHHLFVLTTEYSPIYHKLTILVEQEALAEITKQLIEYQLEFELNHEKQAAIAIVGPNVATNQALIQKVHSKLSKNYEYRIASRRDKEVITLTSSAEPQVLLNSLYDLCFKNKQQSFSEQVADISVYKEDNHEYLAEANG